MKLRLHGNSLRLRVTRPELAALLAEGRIAEATRLGAAPGAALTYSLACADCEAVELRHTADEIAVVLPWPVAHNWSEESETGVNAAVDLGGASLSILVEKDFACLHGTAEDNVGTFPNPKMGQ